MRLFDPVRRPRDMAYHAFAVVACHVVRSTHVASSWSAVCSITGTSRSTHVALPGNDICHCFGGTLTAERRFLSLRRKQSVSPPAGDTHFVPPVHCSLRCAGGTVFRLAAIKTKTRSSKPALAHLISSLQVDHPVHHTLPASDLDAVSKSKTWTSCTALLARLTHVNAFHAWKPVLCTMCSLAAWDPAGCILVTRPDDATGSHLDRWLENKIAVNALLSYCSRRRGNCPGFAGQVLAECPQ